jgi:hypothetical protein
MGEIYEVRRWGGLRCHDMCTKFHKEWLRHSKVNKGDTQKHRENGDLINLILFFWNKGSGLKISEDRYPRISRASLKVSINRRVSVKRKLPSAGSSFGSLPTNNYQSFEGTCRLQLQGRKVNYPEDEGRNFLRNVGINVPHYTATHPKVKQFS